MTECYQIICYVPTYAADEFIAEVSPAIPQVFGHYDHVCWRSSEGIGQFRPLEGADPSDGEIGVINQVPEIRFECLVPDDEAALERFITKTLRPAHPYEAPVITITRTVLV